MRVGPYEILGEIGRGGSGAVFRARGPDGRIVAVKVLHKLSPDALDRFERESRLARTLGESVGFVPVLDAGVQAGAPYLVSPFLEKGTLAARLRSGPLPAPEVLSLGRTLARALGAAHERGIVHRDVKPENVLFDGTGEPLLADLGLAKHFDTAVFGASVSRSLSAAGGFRGTAGYMPPEQMRDAKTAGPPADVFALGCVLYECLCGAPPFEGDSVLETISRVESGQFASVRKLRPETPAVLAAAIERALAPNPKARWADGSEFGAALARRHRGPTWRLPIATLGAAALVVVVVLATRGRGGSPPAPPPPPPPPVRPGPRPEDPSAARVKKAIEAARVAFAQDDDAELDVQLRIVEARAPDDPEAAALRILAATRLHPDASLAGEAAAALVRAPRSPWVQAARAVTDENVAVGERQLREVVAEHPDFEYGHIIIGHMRIGSRDDAGAGRAAQDAIDAGGRFARSWLLRGIVRMQANDAGWQDDLERAVELGPRSAAVHARASRTFLERGQTARARTIVDRALQLDASHYDALITSGEVSTSERDATAAAAAFSRAIAVDSTLLSGWLLRSAARRLLGDKERAASDAERVAERSGDEPGLLALAGITRGDFGHPEPARRMLERALDLGLAPDARAEVTAWLANHPRDADAAPEDLAALLKAARRAYDEGRLAEAERSADRAIFMRPGSSEAWALRGLARTMQQDARGLDDANQAVDLAPASVLARKARAVFFMIREGGDARALVDADAAILYNPRDGGAWQLRAAVRRRAKDLAGTIADCIAAITCPAPDFTALFTLGAVFVEQGHEEAARVALESALPVVNPESNQAKTARDWLRAHPPR